MFGYTIVSEADLNNYIKVANDVLEYSQKQAELYSDSLTKKESEIADLSYVNKWLQEELNKSREENSFRDSLKIDMKEIDFSVLSSANPKLLEELYTLCKICQHTIITQSLKIRKVDGIAYRDGAVDGLELLKAKFKEFFRVVSVKWVKKEDEAEEE